MYGDIFIHRFYYIIKDFYVLESKADIQKIYRQLDVVESTDLEYNKYIAEE